jgi:hypothetical protein
MLGVTSQWRISASRSGSMRTSTFCVSSECLAPEFETRRPSGVKSDWSALDGLTSEHLHERCRSLTRTKRARSRPSGRRGCDSGRARIWRSSVSHRARGEGLQTARTHSSASRFRKRHCAADPAIGCDRGLESRCEGSRDGIHGGGAIDSLATTAVRPTASSPRFRARAALLWRRVGRPGEFMSRREFMRRIRVHSILFSTFLCG